VKTTYSITGSDALRLAQRENLRVRYSDGNPFVIVTPTGWRNAQGNHCDGEGRTVEAYFRGNEYLGPDDEGVEPCWNDAAGCSADVAINLTLDCGRLVRVRQLGPGFLIASGEEAGPCGGTLVVAIDGQEVSRNQVRLPNGITQETERTEIVYT
jgi:hypothetical protein